MPVDNSVDKLNNFILRRFKVFLMKKLMIKIYLNYDVANVKLLFFPV